MTKLQFTAYGHGSPSVLSDAGLNDYVECQTMAGHCPGLSIAVWHRNRLYASASGVANTSVGTRASVDTLFQIGSITKAFTSSLIMLLVDAGSLDLDLPLKRYLPDFHVADSDAVANVTTRHLLSHTSGLESDIYVDDRWEQGNAIARYVDRCFLLPQVHKDFGRRFSYSNAAYVMAGRLIETLAGMPWARAIEELIFEPLGMTHSISSPLQALRHSVATGHMFSYGEKPGWSTAPHAYVPQGLAPAGSVLSMPATELVKFGRAHLEGGQSETGRQWLSEQSVETMQKLQVRLPVCGSLFESGWGLGWGLSELGSIRCFGHSGGRIGYQALLAMVPGNDTVIAVESNGMLLGGGALLRQIFVDLLGQTTGAAIDTTKPREEARDLESFSGLYGGPGFRFRIENSGAQLSVEFVIEGLSTEKANFILKPTTNGDFTVYSQTGQYWGCEAAFLERDRSGIPKYFFFAGRLNARIGTA